MTCCPSLPGLFLFLLGRSSLSAAPSSWVGRHLFFSACWTIFLIALRISGVMKNRRIATLHAHSLSGLVGRVTDEKIEGLRRAVTGDGRLADKPRRVLGRLPFGPRRPEELVQPHEPWRDLLCMRSLVRRRRERAAELAEGLDQRDASLLRDLGPPGVVEFLAPLRLGRPESPPERARVGEGVGRRPLDVVFERAHVFASVTIFLSTWTTSDAAERFASCLL